MTEVLHAFTGSVFRSLRLHPFERLIVLCLLIEKAVEPGETATVKLNDFADFLGASDHQTRVYLRALRQRGVLSALEPTRNGFLVSLAQPTEIPGVSFGAVIDLVDIEDINFFDRQRLPSLLDRQSGRCIYSLKVIDAKDAEIDHIVPQAQGGGHGYRNVVVCSFEMNKRKGSQPYDTFLRALFREGFLSAEEFSQQSALIEAIKAGELVPTI